MRKPRVLPLLLAVWMLCLTVFPAAAAGSSQSTKATTMQLMKTEGTVNVTNASGRSLTKRDNMLLYNGYHVETKAKSYAWINLDSSKLVKLDAVSEAEVRKSGKSLELLLSSGGFFFNVTSPLKEGETLNIRTATMVVGIRGTSGWFKAVDRWSTEIYVLEGTVQCSVSDPVTGQAKEATIQSGEMAVATAYPQDYEGDKCDIVQEKFEPGDIDGFVLEELARAPELCSEIFEKSGLDVLSAVEATQERREQDEQKMQETLDRIGEQQAEQDSGTSTGPVWDQEDPGSNGADSSMDPGSDNNPGDSDNNPGDSDNKPEDSDNNPGGGNSRPGGGDNNPSGDSNSSGSNNDPESSDNNPGGGDSDHNGDNAEIGPSLDPSGTLKNWKTAQDVQDALNQAKDQAKADEVSVVILELNDGQDRKTLIINIPMTIFENVELEVATGIDVVIETGASLTVEKDGSMVVSDNFEINGTLENYGVVVAPNIIDTGRIINCGTINGDGTMDDVPSDETGEGDLTVGDGPFPAGDGETDGGENV